MADVLNPEQRHRCMSNIKGKDTKPEMIVRRHIHACGYRYGLHNSKLPGKPDIVLRRLKTVIFIHGCFWHGHAGCKYFRLPSTRTEFWENKINTNIERDKRNIEELERQGWHVIVIWECNLKSKDIREETLHKLIQELTDISNGTYRYPHYPFAEESEAAEPGADYGD